MGSDLLSTSRLVGITGEEDPLSDADVRFVVERMYSPSRVAAVLDGDDWHPRDGLACVARDGISCVMDHLGIHALIAGPPRRAGLITWQRGDDFIRRSAQPLQLDLFAEVS